jgi:hypothetical protein
MLRMIDTLQFQIQIKCEQAAESAVLYAAAATLKAGTHGVGAPVAEALKAMGKLARVVEQIGVTAYERSELLNIAGLDRTQQPDRFAERVISNTTLTCYYIRLAAPENLMRPLSFNLFQLDGGAGFKALHNTQEITDALADVLELKECADEILMDWNTQLKNLHERAVRTKPIDEICARYDQIKTDAFTSFLVSLSRRSRNIKEDIRQKKEKLEESFQKEVANIAQKMRRSGTQTLVG